MFSQIAIILFLLVVLEFMVAGFFSISIKVNFIGDLLSISIKKVTSNHSYHILLARGKS